MAERRRHLKAEVGISDPARDLIDAAFEAGAASYEGIASAVAAATGETIGKSSIARYWREWRVQQRAREAREIALAQLADLHELPVDKLDEVIEQLLRTNAYESLAQAESGDIDPGKAMRALDARARRKLDEKRLELETRQGQQRIQLDERRLDIDQQRVGLLEQKVAAMTARAGEAAKALDAAAKKKQLDPEDLRTIREQLYGIAGAPENS